MSTYIDTRPLAHFTALLCARPTLPVIFFFFLPGCRATLHRPPVYLQGTRGSGVVLGEGEVSSSGGSREKEGGITRMFYSPCETRAGRPAATAAADDVKVSPVELSLILMAMELKGYIVAAAKLSLQSP